ncbi:unnamed protein product [Chrysoparadoxa australica]
MAQMESPFQGMKILLLRECDMPESQTNRLRDKLGESGAEAKVLKTDSKPKVKTGLQLLAGGKRKAGPPLGASSALSSCLLPPGTTHLIVGQGWASKVNPESREEKLLGVLCIAKEQLQSKLAAGALKVVSSSWLSACFSGGSRVAEDGFVVDVPAAAATKQPDTKRLKLGQTPEATLPFPDATPTYTNEERGPAAWAEVDGGRAIWYRPTTLRHSTHLALFDLDSTMIHPKSGKTHAQSTDDWKFWSSGTRGKSLVQRTVKLLWEAGYRIVVISNNGALADDVAKKEMRKALVDDVLKQLQVPIEVLVACEKIGRFRKPCPGCYWEVEDSNGCKEINKDESFYCGDAAGRPPRPVHGSKKPKADFAPSDFLFAQNIGLKFFTPEQLFEGSKAPVHDRRGPLPYRPERPQPPATPPAFTVETASSALELVILCGPPASGKSFFCENYLPSHTRVNQDTLKTFNKCISAARAALAAKRSVVVDSTNAVQATRAEWLKLAKELNATARCVLMTASKEASFHLRAYRAGCLHPLDGDRRALDKIAIYSSFKKFREHMDRFSYTSFEAALKDEGFESVCRVPVPLPMKICCARDEALFYGYMCLPQYPKASEDAKGKAKGKQGKEDFSW